MKLKEYQLKRNFEKSPEPKGKVGENLPHLRFVIQKHDATRLHFDLRLELEGVFRSFAVPKGLTRDPHERRLAVRVENHPIEYGSFEGVIPKGNYGAGTVMIYDYGAYTDRKHPVDSKIHLLKGFEEGRMSIMLYGRRIKGEYIFLRQGEGKNWLIIKKRDQFAHHKNINFQTSIVTGRTMEQIAHQSLKHGEIWVPGKGPQSKRAIKQLAADETPSDIPMQTKTTYKFNGLPLEMALLKKEAAPTEPMPLKLKMMDAASLNELFAQKGWLFCPLFGGVRAMIYVDHFSSKILSRAEIDISQKYQEILCVIKSMKTTCVLDTEIFFTHLENNSIEKRPQEGSIIVCSILDILHLNGKNLRVLPLKERLKCLLEISELKAKPFTSKVQAEDSAKPLTERNDGHIKEILCRDSTSTYKKGVHSSWQKFSIHQDKSPGLHFRNLSKVMFPELGLTKKDVLSYYEGIAPFILPHLRDRPLSLHRHPHGIHSESFYQKDIIGYTPSYISVAKITSRNKAQSTHYMLCQNLESLLYLVNLGCIEFHPFFSKVNSISRPDFAVIDLDPCKQPFSFVVEVALKVHELLNTCSFEHFIKTSGATGIHIAVPLTNASFTASLEFAKRVCKMIQKRLPHTTTTERSKSKRQGRLYLDAFQNRRSQTIASVYSLRPQINASVSMPLEFAELTDTLKPSDFNIKNSLKRVLEKGDLFQSILEGGPFITADDALEVLRDLEEGEER